MNRFLRTLGLALVLSGLAAGARAESILFIGNSFTFGATSAVKRYRPDTVTDLNGEGIGGVPALFKAFTRQAGLDYQVSLETSPGKNFDYHYEQKLAVIDRPWDVVVMHGYSTLDAAAPGNPDNLIKYGTLLNQALIRRNPAVKVYLTATWSRADLTYLPSGFWYGRSISGMAQDIRDGYDKLKKANPTVRAVLPVGQAWTRAIMTGVADADPYDGVAFGQVNLWGWDQYHASAAGYYLEALVVFGGVTGLDPRSLGDREISADEIGLSPGQAHALQAVAYDQLVADGKLKPTP